MLFTHFEKERRKVKIPFLVGQKKLTKVFVVYVGLESQNRVFDNLPPFVFLVQDPCLNQHLGSIVHLLKLTFRPGLPLQVCSFNV